ncbi:putative AP2/ERF and B3 domain-containing protein Os01g0140700 [Cryptomeria japonica]|uniref:putative AP2/ERF and B3 domain-containing protein Os01g0140700 n=1 Tax=Cryptomeria japonica TaxID=3369 RepID=UPI0027DA0062|nr:putative AP2/ERF and B3 domain-containing protein Os01g0140700 [Cryptomeria japonica]XP_057827019.2 putative AP2/ERF and B3 domain-containing protein Os01g0140700 [Cryptomeria japonica]XP_057827020.2 putative AP2/ERF and B3 domain-containing protein Os01g0140700 [Cryptomeria japonica]XP_057827021.2 putative AP2/ERF and B3 domain-containing protein Os01g0140700 [Cryptomeria japonica]XP_057827023.2 putative AP2/ERF and B3 domain-containing protein Os01g0140700 [Cryptomeria japonica]
MEETKSSADSNASSGSSKTGHAIVAAPAALNAPLGQLENTAELSEHFACQFKGVVPQHNKKWGAQIYVSHGRVWLGTFISQEAAALAYDRACLKFRGLDCQRNLLSKEDCQIEIMFQQQYKEEHVVQMIREHTYEEHLNEFMAKMGRDKFFQNQSKPHLHHDNTIPQHLFDKEVTPSDVGKLNRLVIPKQHAERNFPRESQIKDKDESLVFLDVENNKEWEFRYSFWKSSQSYVLTRGWSKFVKEKILEAGDIVSFQRCNATGRLYISVSHRYRRDTVSADISYQQTIGRPPNFLYPSSPFGRSEFWVLVNGRPMQFYNNNPGLVNYVPLHMGYSSRGLHGISNAGGIVSNNDTARDLREQRFFPAYGTSVAEDNGMGLAANGGSNSVRLFGVEIGASIPDSD